MNELEFIGKVLIPCAFLLSVAGILAWGLIAGWIKRRRHDAVTDWEYVVDITQPPIGPPSVEMWDDFGCLHESRKSKRRSDDWARYIKEYGQARDASRSNK